MRAHIAQLTFIVGAFLMVVSFMAGAPSYQFGPVEPGIYDGYFYATTADLHISIASTDDKNLSLYLLSYDQGLRALEEKSLDNVSVIFEMENFNSYDGTPNLPRPSWYAILITPVSTESSAVAYNMTVQRVVPYVGVLAAGLLMIVFAIMLDWREIRQSLLKLIHIGSGRTDERHPNLRLFAS